MNLTQAERDDFVRSVESAVKRAQEFDEANPNHNRKSDHLIGALSIILGEIDPRLEQLLLS